MARQTSIAAYYDIRDQGLLSKRRFQVYEALVEHGPCTANELYKKIGQTHTNAANITTRLGELRECSVAFESGTRKCSVTGRNVTVWDVNDSLPKTVEKPRPKSERYKELLNFVVASPEVNQCFKDILVSKGRQLGLVKKGV